MADSDRPAGSPLAVQLAGGRPPVASTDALYASPTAPTGSVVVVIESGSTTLRASSLVAVLPLASLTVTLTVDWPVEVGVPEMVLPDSDNPAGRLLTCQVYGDVPPDAWRVVV